nr:hypothetical protein [Mucilaginibacter sp. X5P1]
MIVEFIEGRFDDWVLFTISTLVIIFNDLP